MSRLKRLKLKKIQPGNLIKRGIHAAAAIGIPGAGTADKLADRIGKRVEDINKVAAKARDVIKREANDSGVSTAEATDRLIARGLAGADASISTQLAAPEAAKYGMVAIAIVALILLMRGK